MGVDGSPAQPGVDGRCVGDSAGSRGPEAEHMILGPGPTKTYHTLGIHPTRTASPGSSPSIQATP